MKRIVITLLFAVSTTVFAGVVEDLNIVISTNMDGSFTYLVYQNEDASDVTCGNFRQINATNLLFESVCLDEGSDWYLADYGQMFDSNSIANGDFTFVAGWTPGPVYKSITSSIPIGSFFMAINTGQGISEINRSVFGWAQLFNNGCTLTLLDSAVAYGTNSITIGEPGSTPLDNLSLIAYSDFIVQKGTGSPNRERRNIIITSIGPPCGNIVVEYISSTNSEWIELPGALPIFGVATNTFNYQLSWPLTNYPTWQHFRTKWIPD